MRCCVCDYSPSAPSEYNNGMTKASWGNKLKWDRVENGYVCSECEASSMEALNELILPDEEVVFNKPTFTTSKTR